MVKKQMVLKDLKLDIQLDQIFLYADDLMANLTNLISFPTFFNIDRIKLILERQQHNGEILGNIIADIINPIEKSIDSITDLAQESIDNLNDDDEWNKYQTEVFNEKGKMDKEMIKINKLINNDKILPRDFDELSDKDGDFKLNTYFDYLLGSLSDMENKNNIVSLKIIGMQSQMRIIQNKKRFFNTLSKNGIGEDTEIYKFINGEQLSNYGTLIEEISKNQSLLSDLLKNSKAATRSEEKKINEYKSILAEIPKEEEEE